MTGWPLGSVPDEEKQLADLRWHWDTAYEINLSGATWTARFLAAKDTVSTGSADDLRQLIRVDYLARKMAPPDHEAAADIRTHEPGAGELALRQLRQDGVI